MMAANKKKVLLSSEKPEEKRFIRQYYIGYAKVVAIKESGGKIYKSWIYYDVHWSIK